MSDIYTVEIDGVEYDIEGDRPPTEAEARAAVGAFDSAPQRSTQPPPSAMSGMLAPSTSQGGPEPQGPVFGMQPKPELTAMLEGAERMDAPLTPRVLIAGAKAVPGIIAKGGAMVSRALDNPLVGGAVGAIEGGRRGGVEGVLTGALVGATGSGLHRGLRGLRRLTPRARSPRSPSPSSTAPASQPVGSTWTRWGAPSAKPAATPSAPMPQPMPSSAAPAPTTQAQALQREVMMRDPNWRNVDAVPIDAIKRDITRGGSIIEAGESRIALGERLAAAVKKGDKAEMERLARAIRQREHISGKR